MSDYLKQYIARWLTWLAGNDNSHLIVAKSRAYGSSTAVNRTNLYIIRHKDEWLAEIANQIDHT